MVQQCQQLKIAYISYHGLSTILSGRVYQALAPLVASASLTAIRKENGGVRPIAVGDVFHRLVSSLSCTAINPNLPSFFIPYGKVGVRVNGGKMAVINVLRLCISENADNEFHCLLKVDMHNTFNKCCHSTFLSQHFSLIFGWVQWCYQSSAELYFG